jgi:hypothetical protein
MNKHSGSDADSINNSLRAILSRTTRAPNLFLLGAAKSGTTSLYNILRQHKDVHACDPKEPSFFCSYFQIVKDPEVYMQLFDDPARFRFDASHVYLSNPETPRILKQLFPAAKFIVTMRHPKRRAYSLYRHMRRNLHDDGKPLEDLSDFRIALEAEATRYASSGFFAGCRQYFWNFLYCRSSLYDEQLARYFHLFDRSQFHFLSLAELSTDPVATTRKITDFLGLDHASLRNFDFSIRNSGGPYETWDAPCDRFMDQAFSGLTDRVDRLVGRPLDWSL